MPLLGERGGGKDPPRLKIETDANNNNNNNNDNNNNNNNNRGLSTTVVFNHRTKNPITGGGGGLFTFWRRVCGVDTGEDDVDFI